MSYPDRGKHASEEREYLAANGWTRLFDGGDLWYHPNFAHGFSHWRHEAAELTRSADKSGKLSEPLLLSLRDLRDYRNWVAEMQFQEEQRAKDGITLAAMRAEGAARAFEDSKDLLDTYLDNSKGAPD